MAASPSSPAPSRPPPPTRPPQTMWDSGKYTIVEDTGISLGEFPGRAVKLSQADGDFLVWNHVYLAGARMYQVMAVVSKADEAKSTANVTRFLDSFKIVK